MTETIQDNTAIIEKKTELLRQKQVLLEKEAAFEEHWSRVSKGPKGACTYDVCAGRGRGYPKSRCSKEA